MEARVEERRSCWERRTLAGMVVGPCGTSLTANPNYIVRQCKRWTLAGLGVGLWAASPTANPSYRLRERRASDPLFASNG
jgi:hypothetical protein